MTTRRQSENDSTHYSTSLLYRRVNDEILKLDKRFHNINDYDHRAIVCECGDPRCAEPIEMTLDEYQQLRSNPDNFAVKPEHRRWPNDVVQAENSRYWTLTLSAAADSASSDQPSHQNA